MASSSNSARKTTKRKRVVPLESKIAVLERLKSGASHAKIAKEFVVGTSTVSDIKKEASVRAFASSMENMAMNKKERKVMHLADDHELD